LSVLQRRSFTVALCAAAATGSAWAAAGPSAPPVLACAWSDTAGHWVGLMQPGAVAAAGWRVRAKTQVPTRAHGLFVEPDGHVLAVARRPGDWLLRWQPGATAALHWAGPERSFNGHVERRRGQLFSTETERESGGGQLVVRDAATLRTLAVWPTFGRDPHDLLFSADGSVWVANGGIETWPETGRSKRLDHMDSSLVQLDAKTGALRGQWRLEDSRLSLRHLAQAADGSVGVALQAEHDDAAARNVAPLLAVWRDGALQTAAPADADASTAPGLAGYGGDIAAVGSVFAVSATRAGRVALWRSNGRFEALLEQPAPCALCTSGHELWAAGAQGVNQSSLAPAPHSTAHPGLPVLLDNHMLPWRGPLHA
jgi:uncharacterized protein